MKKRIWILNHYAGNMFFDFGGRHYAFAKYLRREGYEPVVFCSNTKHGKPECFFQTEKLWEAHLAEEIDVPFVFVKARTYVGNGKQRFLNMVDFYRNVRKAAKEYAQVHGRPDVIYASSVHPLTLVAGIQLAKHYSVPCVCEIRDLWPFCIVEYAPTLGNDSLLIRLLYQGEKWIYQRADALIFTWEGAYDYILDKGWNQAIPRTKCTMINNGVDMESFQENLQTYTIQDSDLINQDAFNVVYTGTIRHVNNLGLLLDVAKIMQEMNIRFLVWGDGDEMDSLKQRTERENIHNVIFKGRVKKEYIPYITSHADLNIAHNSPGPRFRYGISFNKIFDYLAAGKPVMLDFPCKYNPIENWNAGITVDTPTPEEIARAILKIMNMSPDEYRRLCQNAKKAAQHYDYAALVKDLEHVFQSVWQRGD